MKFLNLITFILIVFFKTGNVLCNPNIFNVNNIEIIKNPGFSNEQLTKKAILKGFDELKYRILLEDDKKKLLNLNYSEINNLVAYYQVKSEKEENRQESNKVNYNIFFDKDKLYDLFFKKSISYSEILNKEVFLLPLFKKDNQIFIYNQNYFYDKWNLVTENSLIEFILPLENIEIIQKINSNIDNLISLDLKNLFKEYENKNLALIIIEDTGRDKVKIYLKTNISENEINKSLQMQRENKNNEKFYLQIINQINKEIENIVKAQNLIDIKTPSFLNTTLITNNKNNLVELNKRLNRIDLIDNIYVQEFNNKYVILRIKYYGKLSKIIKQLEKEKIILKLIKDKWSIRII